MFTTNPRTRAKEEGALDMRPGTTRTLLPLVALAFAASALWTSSAWAQGQTGASTNLHSSTEYTDSEMGFAALIGPQIGMTQSPTAAKLQVQYWHELWGPLSFHAGLAASFGGTTVFTATAENTEDAAYDATFGGEFQAGVRYLLPIDSLPFDVFTRGALAVDIVGGAELIGYMFGPALAIGASYPIAQGISINAETELGLGFAQYKAAGSVFAATLDIMAGVQFEF